MEAEKMLRAERKKAMMDKDEEERRKARDVLAKKVEKIKERKEAYYKEKMMRDSEQAQQAHLAQESLTLSEKKMVREAEEKKMRDAELARLCLLLGTEKDR